MRTRSPAQPLLQWEIHGRQTMKTGTAGISQSYIKAYTAEEAEAIFNQNWSEYEICLVKQTNIYPHIIHKDLRAK